MSGETHGALTFETILTDPLIRLVMDSDGVSVDEFVAVLLAAGHAVARRDRLAETMGHA